LRTVADQLLIVQGGRLTPFDGDLDDYAQRLAELDLQEAASPPAPAAAPEAPRDSMELRRRRRREQAERRSRLAPLRAQIAQYDQELTRLAEHSVRVQAQLASPEAYSDAARERLRELIAEQATLERETQRVEAAWLAASEQLEAEEQSNQP
jgi:ATP-binding cassette subfamily F protein 3